MTLALLALTAARAAHDLAVDTLWLAQSLRLEAASADAPRLNALAERVHASYASRESAARDALTLAFDAVAAERSAASPVRLVVRELTPAEASALAAAEMTLAVERAMNAHDTTAVWLAQGDLLAAIEAGDVDTVIARERMLECHRENLDETTASASDALAHRAPLLAARWQEASP